jgi:hypothetical protein
MLDGVGAGLGAGLCSRRRGGDGIAGNALRLWVGLGGYILEQMGFRWVVYWFRCSSRALGIVADAVAVARCQS